MKEKTLIQNLNFLDEFKFLNGKCIWSVQDNRGGEIVIDNGRITKHIWVEDYKMPIYVYIIEKYNL